MGSGQNLYGGSKMDFYEVSIGGIHNLVNPDMVDTKSREREAASMLLGAMNECGLGEVFPPQFPVVLVRDYEDDDDEYIGKLEIYITLRDALELLRGRLVIRFFVSVLVV